MQIQILVEHFLRSPESDIFKLTTQEKLLLFFLGSYCGNKNTCWPSYKLLAKNLSVRNTRLRLIIQSLEKKNLITVTRKHRNNNIYCLNINLLRLNGILKENFEAQRDTQLGSTGYSIEAQRDTPITSYNNNNNNSGNDCSILTQEEQEQRLKNIQHVKDIQEKNPFLKTLSNGHAKKANEYFKSPEK